MQASFERACEHPTYVGGTAVPGPSIANFLLMVVFFGVIFAIPVLWYVLGIKTYGTGDYHQP